MRPTRAQTLRVLALITLSTLASSKSTADFSTKKLFVVCVYPESKKCLWWSDDMDEGAQKFNNTEGVVAECGLSDLKTIPPHRKFISVKLSNRVAFCRITDLKKAIAPKGVPFAQVNRVRRQSAPRGRYRGQTQSQYLSIDRGNENDEGKAEAHSAADSSRAVVSGNSGMGQAQSQTIYDPNCEDSLSQSEIGAASLMKKPGPNNFYGSIGSVGSSDPNQQKYPGGNSPGIQSSNWPDLPGNQISNSRSPGGVYTGQNIPGRNIDSSYSTSLDGKPISSDPRFPSRSFNQPGTMVTSQLPHVSSRDQINPDNYKASQSFPPNQLTNQQIPPEGQMKQPSLQGSNNAILPGPSSVGGNQPGVTGLPGYNQPGTAYPNAGNTATSYSPYGVGGQNDLNNPNIYSGKFPNQEQSNLPTGVMQGQTKLPDSAFLTRQPGGGALTPENQVGDFSNIGMPTQAGIYGANSNQPGIDGANSNQPGTYGVHSNQPGTYGAHSNQPGTYGANSNQPGTYGSNTNQPGTYGTNSNQPGSYGVNLNQPGTYGSNTNQPGTYGTNSNQPGSYGVNSNQPGTYGSNKNQPGTYGTNSNQPGTYGTNSNQPRSYRPNSNQPYQNFGNYPIDQNGVTYPGGNGNTNFPKGVVNWPLLSSLLPGGGDGSTYLCCVVSPGNGPQSQTGHLKQPINPENQNGAGNADLNRPPSGTSGQRQTGLVGPYGTGGPIQPGEIYGPGGTGGSGPPGGTYGPGGNAGLGRPDGSFGQIGTGNSGKPGGTYGPVSSGESPRPGGAYRPGGTGGSEHPGGTYGPGGSGLPGRTYGPGGTGGSALPGGIYRPGSTESSGQPDGTYGSGSSGGTAQPGGIYGPGGTRGSGQPGGIYGPGGTRGSGQPDGTYGPGSTGGTALPGGMYGPGGTGGSGQAGGIYGPRDTGASGHPGGTYGPGSTGSTALPGGMYGPGGTGGSGQAGGIYGPGGPGVSGQPSGTYGPGSSAGTALPGGIYGPGSPGVSGQPGGTYGPGSSAGTALPGGIYGPGGTAGSGQPGGIYGLGSSGGTALPGGTYGPGSTGGTALPNGLNGPGGTGGSGQPGGTYGPGSTGGTALPGGMYGPGGTAGSGQPGGIYGPGGPGVSGQPGGTYGPGSSAGSALPAGIYRPGSTGVSEQPDGAYGPESAGGIAQPGGIYGPGGTGSGPHDLSGSGKPSGTYWPAGTGGSAQSGGTFGPGTTGLNGQASGNFVPGGSGGNVLYGTGGTGQNGLQPSGVYGAGNTGVNAPSGQQGGTHGPGLNGPYGAESIGQNRQPSGTYRPGGTDQNGPGQNGQPGGLYGSGSNKPYGTEISGPNGQPSGAYGPGSNGPYGTGMSGQPSGTYGSGSNKPYGTGNSGQNGEPGGAYGTGVTGQREPWSSLSGTGNLGPESLGQNLPSGYPGGYKRPGAGNELSAGPNNDSGGVPQNVIDSNSIMSSLDGYDSEAQASVSQAVNGTTALASSKGGNKSGRAQTQVEGTYTGTGSFSANAEISDDSKAAQSHVSGSKKGASSSAEGKGRKNKSQASVNLGSETGSILTDSQSSGDLHSSNSQVQGSVKGGMADAQAKGPGSTSSQAQIGFTPYKEEDKKAHEVLKTPFEGAGTASAQTSGRMGTSQSQLRGTFKYGITYSGAAQAGSSLDKDAVFSNLLPFEKINVFDEKNKNINVDATTTTKSEDEPVTAIEEFYESTTSTTVESKTDSNDEILDHNHSDHHKLNDNQLNTTTRPPPEGTRRSFKTNYGSNAADYEYTTDRYDNPQDYDLDDGFGPDVSDNGPDQNEYPNYDELGRDQETTHESLQSASKKGLDVKQTTGGNTQHIILGSLKNHDAKIIQKNSEHPDESKVYQAGERVPGMGGYTIPVGFTGSVKSVASRDKTIAVGSRYSPSQAQTVSLGPGTGKIKYAYPERYGKNVHPKDLRSLYNTKPDDNRYVSVSKSVTRDLDNENNIRRQYSHTYYSKSSSCGYFTFTCTMVSSAEGKKKVCRPTLPTNPDGSPMRC